MENQSLKKYKIISTLPKILFFVALATVPFVFFPVKGSDVLFAKGSIFSILILFSFLFFVIEKIVSGKIEKINKYFSFGVISVIGATVLSIVFSSNIRDSLFSDNFNLTSGAVIVSLFLASVLSFYFLGKRKNRDIFIFVSALISLVFMLFHIARIVSGGTLLQSIFPSLTSTLFGLWTDLSIVSLGLALFSFVTIDCVSLSKKNKYILGSFGVFSLLFSLLSKDSSIWFAFGIASLFFFIARMVEISKKDSKKIPTTSLFLVVSSIVFILLSPSINLFVENKLNINERVVRPSFVSTINTSEKVISESSLFGEGVGRFDIAWQKYKPKEVVLDQDFWDTRFVSGYSFVTTFFAMAGVVGILSMILLYVLSIKLISVSLGKIFRQQEEERDPGVWQFMVMSVFMLSLMVVYTPGIVPMVFLLSCFGIFAYITGKKDESPVNFLSDPRSTFFFLVIGMAVVVFSVLVIFGSVRRTFGEIFLIKSANSFVSGNIEDSKIYLVKSISSSPTDKAYRMGSSVFLNNIVEIAKSETESPDIKSSFAGNLYKNMESYILSSLEYDKEDSQNWIYSGIVYTTLIPFGVEKVDENAIYAFDQARLYDPNNPAIDLYRADVYIAKSNLDMAKQIVETAIQEKPNFINAYLYLINIEKVKNGLSSAVDVANDMVMAIPSSSISYRVLGDLLYESGNKKDALYSYEKALSLEPANSSIAYNIALLAYQTGNIERSTEIYNALISFFPDSQKIISLGEMLNGSKTISSPILEEDPTSIDEVPEVAQ